MNWNLIMRSAIGAALLALFGVWVFDASSNEQAAAAAPDEVIAEVPGGRLETISGMPVLFLFGSAEERAEAEGYLMAKEIHETFREFVFNPLAFRNPTQWDTVALPKVRSQFVFPEATKAWAKGVAIGMKKKLGAKMRLSALDRDFSADDLLGITCIPDLRGLNCSSFVAWGDRTKEDGHFVARNLDYFGTPKMTRNTMMIVRAPLGNRRGWAGIGWPGMSGCLTGFSDRGVTIAIHDVRAPYRRGKREARFTPRVIALQDLIETAEPSADLGKIWEKRFAGLEYVVGSNAMIAWRDKSAQGACVLEMDSSNEAGKHATLRQNKVPFISCSNHHRLRSKSGHSCPRFARLEKGGADAGREVLDRASAWSLIESTSVSLTIYRNLYDFDSGILEVDRRISPGGEFAPRAAFDLAKLLSSAKPAVKEQMGSTPK